MATTSSLKILILGGSGFVSGTLAKAALSAGHRVWAVTRGQRPLTAGVTSLVADRHDAPAFARAIAAASTRWDLVVDCIAYEPADAKQDLAVFRGRAAQLIFISTDFVYDPARRRFPQPEESEHYTTAGYGGNKRLCELELLRGDAGPMAWTILRPCHIYGPGSQLGCLPLHGRDTQLIARLRAGEPLKLVGGGHFLQQPIFAADLAQVILSLAGLPGAGPGAQADRQIFNVAGPDVVESREFYRIIAVALGVEVTIEEVGVAAHLATHPEAAPFLCHRVYDLGKLRAVGAAVPGTALAMGLREHVASIAG